MEELRSTEVLEKQIMDVAGKKAEKIKLDAEKVCEQILSEVDLRLENAKKEKQVFFDEKISHHKKDLDASLSLEKSRFVVSFVSSSVASAINDYLKQLSAEKRMTAVLSMLKNFTHLTDGKTFDASVYGFDINSTKAQLEKAGLKITSCTNIAFEKSGEAAIEGIDLHEGIILTLNDKSVKIRLTLEELVSELIDKYRNELAVTLFGGRIPE